MRFSTSIAALAPVVAVSAEVINVMVGQGGLMYSPSSVNASVGDTIAFTFVAKNHTVTQSTFAQPCQNMTTPTEGIDSGFQAVAAGATSLPQWSFTLNNASTPLWFYCRQTGHCEAGMVFAVNPTATKSFQAFQAAAMASSPNSTTGSGSGSASVPGATGGSSTSTGTSSAASSTSTNGAMRMGGSAAGLLTAVGVFAGLVL